MSMEIILSFLANLDEFFAHTKEHCADLNEVNCVICRLVFSHFFYTLLLTILLFI
jgi:hypothetical protein